METENKEDLNCFNWCPLPSDVWYHIINFWVSDSNEKLVSLDDTIQILRKSADKKTLTLFGEIISTKGSSGATAQRMGIRTEIVTYELNFGKSVTDTNRGLWYKDVHDAWYKLEEPFTPEYDLFLKQTLGSGSFYTQCQLQTTFLIRHVLNINLTSNEDQQQSMILENDNTHYYILRGGLVPRADSAERPILNVQIAVNRYSIHLGSKCIRGSDQAATGFTQCSDTLDSDKSEIWMQDVYGNWYKVLSYSSSYASVAENCLRSTLYDMCGYNWAAKKSAKHGAQPVESEVWRHIKEYVVRSHNGEMLSIDQIKSQSSGNTNSSASAIIEGSCILSGVLLSRPDSSNAPIAVNVLIDNYAIDFGLTQTDPQRGLWVSDIHGNWYKLDAPSHPSYLTLAESAVSRCEQFLQLYDALVYLDKTTSTYQENTGKLYCNKTIQALHRESDAYFSLDFVCDNKTYILQHLAATFDFRKSSTLIKSINDLSSNMPVEVIKKEAIVKAKKTQQLGETSGDDALLQIGIDTAKEIPRKKRVSSNVAKNEPQQTQQVTKAAMATVVSKSKPIAKRPRLEADDDLDVEDIVSGSTNRYKQAGSGTLTASKTIVSTDRNNLEGNVRESHNPLWPTRPSKVMETPVPTTSILSSQAQRVENAMHSKMPPPQQLPAGDQLRSNDFDQFHHPLQPAPTIAHPLPPATPDWRDDARTPAVSHFPPFPFPQHPYHHQQQEQTPHYAPSDLRPVHLGFEQHQSPHFQNYHHQQQQRLGPFPPHFSPQFPFQPDLMPSYSSPPQPPPRPTYPHPELSHTSSSGFSSRHYKPRAAQQEPEFVANPPQPPPPPLAWNDHMKASVPEVTQKDSNRWERNTQGKLEQQVVTLVRRKKDVDKVADIDKATQEFDEKARDKKRKERSKRDSGSINSRNCCIYPDCSDVVSELKCGTCVAEFQLQPSFCFNHSQHKNHSKFMNSTLGIAIGTLKDSNASVSFNEKGSKNNDELRAKETRRDDKRDIVDDRSDSGKDTHRSRPRNRSEENLTAKEQQRFDYLSPPRDSRLERKNADKEKDKRHERRSRSRSNDRGKGHSDHCKDRSPSPEYVRRSESNRNSRGRSDRRATSKTSPLTTRDRQDRKRDSSYDRHERNRDVARGGNRHDEFGRDKNSERLGSDREVSNRREDRVDSDDNRLHSRTRQSSPARDSARDRDRDIWRDGVDQRQPLSSSKNTDPVDFLAPVIRFVPSITEFQSDRHMEEREAKKGRMENAHKSLLDRLMSKNSEDIFGVAQTSSQTPEDFSLLSNRNNPVYFGVEALKRGGAPPERTTHHPLSVGWGDRGGNKMKKVGTGSGFKDDNHMAGMSEVESRHKSKDRESRRSASSMENVDQRQSMRGERLGRVGRDNEIHTEQREQREQHEPTVDDYHHWENEQRNKKAADDVLAASAGMGRGRAATQPAWMTSGRSGTAAGVDVVSPRAVPPPKTVSPLTVNSGFKRVLGQYNQQSGSTAMDSDRAQSERSQAMGRGREATHPAWMTQQRNGNDGSEGGGCATGGAVMNVVEDVILSRHDREVISPIASRICVQCNSLRKSFSCTESNHMDGQRLTAASATDWESDEFF